MTTKPEPAPTAQPAEKTAETVAPDEKPAEVDTPKALKKLEIVENARARALAAMQGKKAEAKAAKAKADKPAKESKAEAKTAEPAADEGVKQSLTNSDRGPKTEDRADPEPKETTSKATDADKPKADAAPSNDEMRRRYAAIAREEQRIRREREEARAEAERTRAEMEKARKTLEAIERINSGDVLAGLEQLGTSYEKITSAAIMGKRAPGASVDAVKQLVKESVEAETRQLREQLESERQARADAESRASVASFHDDIRRTILADKSDRWELVQLEHDDFAEAVRREIARNWEADGRPLDANGHAICLTAEEAADRMEARLLEAHNRRMRAKKLKAGGEQSGDPKPEDDAQQPLQATERAQTGGTSKKPPKTLTNTDASSVSRNGSSSDPKVARARALAVMREQRRAATS